MGSRHASHSDSIVLNRSKLGRMTRESRAFGMRYHPFTKAPIRAQIEPVRLDCATSSTLISTLMRWHLVAGLGSYATTGVQHVVQDRMAGTTCRSRLGGPVPRSHHPIAHSAAVPPKFEPPAIGIRALEPSHSEDRFLASVTPIRRRCPNFRMSTNRSTSCWAKWRRRPPRPTSRRRSSPAPLVDGWKYSRVETSQVT